jgi:hypothetical protein
MFANGDQVFKVPSEVQEFADELGVDITGKSSAEIERALETKLNEVNLIGKGGLLFDYTDPLDYALTGASLFGVGIAGKGAYKAYKTAKAGTKLARFRERFRNIRKALNPTRGKKPGIQNPITGKFGPRNPYNPLSYNYDPSKIVGYGGAAALGGKIFGGDDPLNQTPPNISELLKSLENQENANKIKVEDKLSSEEMQKNKLDEIDSFIKNYQTASDVFKAQQNEKNRISGRNKQNIFMEEVAASLAKNRGYMGAGGAEGAANAALRMSEEEGEAEAARIKLAATKAGQGDLTPTEKIKVSGLYSESIKHLDNMGFIMGELETLNSAIDSGAATGAAGIYGRLRDKVAGFTGFNDETVNDATKAKQILEFIRSQLIRELLNESGRTISNLDRQLINQITGDIEDLGSGRGAIKEAIRRVQDRIRTAVTESQNNISFIDAEYGQSMPNLEIYRRGFGNYAAGTYSSAPDDVEVTENDTID